jgi:hypothetical protein
MSSADDIPIPAGFKEARMGSSKKSSLVVNVLIWLVAGLLHPLANLLPKPNGETPKIFSLLIPLAFIGLAYLSTYLIWQAMASQGAGQKAEPTDDPARR